MSIAVGDRIGPYEVVGRIGAGGMGEVYKAIDSRLQRTVAIKVLPELFSRDEERLRLCSPGRCQYPETPAQIRDAAVLPIAGGHRWYER